MTDLNTKDPIVRSFIDAFDQAKSRNGGYFSTSDGVEVHESLDGEVIARLCGNNGNFSVTKKLGQCTVEFNPKGSDKYSKVGSDKTKNLPDLLERAVRNAVLVEKLIQ